MDYQLVKYRSDDNGASNLVYVENDGWVCGDSLGRFYSLSLSSTSWNSKEMVDTPVKAFTVSPDGQECLIGTMECVHIHRYPDVDECELARAGKPLHIDARTFA